MYTHEFWARESRLSGNMFIWCTCVHTDQMQACIPVIIALFWVTYLPQVLPKQTLRHVPTKCGFKH